MSIREAKQRRANVDDLTAGRESWNARLLPFRRTFIAVLTAEKMLKQREYRISCLGHAHSLSRLLGLFFDR